MGGSNQQINYINSVKSKTKLYPDLEIFISPIKGGWWNGVHVGAELRGMFVSTFIWVMVIYIYERSTCRYVRQKPWMYCTYLDPVSTPPIKGCSELRINQLLTLYQGAYFNSVHCFLVSFFFAFVLHLNDFLELLR